MRNEAVLPALESMVPTVLTIELLFTYCFEDEVEVNVQESIERCCKISYM